MLSPIVHHVQRQHCWKRGGGDGQRLSLYDYGTTEWSFNAVERWGSTHTCTVCTAADRKERQICTTCLFAESVGLWKSRRSYLYVCFLRSWSWSTLLFERGLGEEGRFDVASRSQTPKTSCQNHKQQLLRPRSGPRVEQTASTEQISKKGIKLILKTIGNRKEIVREVVRGDKHNLRKSENCKAQISTTICGVNDTDLCVAISRFSQVVFVTSNNFTHNLLFYFQ